MGSEITVCEHSLQYHPQMQVKAPSYKEESICEHDPNAVMFSVANKQSFIAVFLYMLVEIRPVIMDVICARSVQG